MVLGPFDSERECKNALNYVRTKFFRFMVLLHKASQDATSKVYKFVPIQDFSQSWDDQALYDKYGITASERSFIDSLVRPMESE